MQTFSFKRFSLLVKKGFTENIRAVIKTILISLFIVLVLIIVEIINSPNQTLNLNKSFDIYYYIGLFILGAGVAGFSFPAFRKTEKSTNYLLLPASSLEKYLSYLLLSLIGFYAVYTSMFRLFDYSVVLIYNIIYPENLQLAQKQDILGLLKMFIGIRHGKSYYMFFILLNINALFLLGAITFKKSQHFKTVFFTLLAAISVYAIAAFMVYSFNHYDFSITSYALTGSKFEFGSDGVSKIINIDDIVPISILKNLFYYGLALFFYYIGYLKFKEKEV